MEQVLEALQAGDVALVSDAGTPGLNDPGYELVRAAIVAGHSVSPIPGPCAPIAALVASGLPTDTFIYLGYLPRKSSDRMRLLKQVTDYPFTLIFLDAPHRLMKSLQEMRDLLGDRQIAVGRELTKLHEEIYRGNLSQVIDHFTENPPRGEFTLVVSGKTTHTERWSEQRLKAVLEANIISKLSSSQLAAQLADQSGWSRREIYQKLLKIRGK